MSFVQLAVDDFQRVDENPLSDDGKWSASQTPGNAPLQLVSHQAESSILGHSGAGESFFTGISFPNDQYVEVVVGNYNPDELMALIVRGNPSSQAHYRVVFSDGYFYIRYIDSSGAASLLLDGAITINTGDILRFAVQGTTLTVYQNGAAFGSASDSNLSSGTPGVSLSVYIAETDLTISHFAAGQVSDAPTGGPTEIIEADLLQLKSGAIDLVAFRNDLVGLRNS